MKPIVSICCITYNHEKYISDAIESFLMQEISFPFEIIIHDDASTDDTANIIKEYEKEYPQYINISKCYNKIDRVIFHLKYLKVFKNISYEMKEKDYDIIHAHSLFSNGYIAYKLKREYGISYIVAVRNTDVNIFFSKIIHLRSLGVNILKNAEKIVFISEPYRKKTINKFIPNEFKEEIERKSVVIPNGIDKFWFNNKFNARRVPREKEIRIIYVESINENKNIETTVKACKLLIEQGDKVRYKIIGEIINNRYKDFIIKHPFIEYISYCEKELINQYRNLDIFVMPSKHEPFGLVYAEAMSQGLPVIYSKNQGFDEQFEDGEIGYSVEYNSSEEIASKIKYILSDYKSMSNNGIDKVDKFNWEMIGKEYKDKYNIKS